ncbi:MAG: alpha-glucuronidase family glycosyl hydrolase, partial [Armatimonadota bacterium]
MLPHATATKPALWCLFCLALWVACTLPAAAFTLAEAGKAQAVIVLPEKPTPAEKTAATELASYLGKITGAAFRPLSADQAAGRPRILVGPSAAARKILSDAVVDGLGSEEFVIRTVGRDLLLVGGRPRGTLYAVYSF